MKTYELVLAAGIYLTALSANPAIKETPTTRENSLKTEASAAMKDYTFLFDVGGVNPTEGAGVDIIHNNDTTKMYTNVLGTVNFKARPEDKVLFYPTEKSGKFNNIEFKLTNNDLNIVVIDPKTNVVDTTSYARNYKTANLEAKANKIDSTYTRR